MSQTSGTLATMMPMTKTAASMKLYSMDMAMMKKMMPITMAMAEIWRSRLSGRLEE